MMLRHVGWTQAADFITKGMQASIATKKVTYDFARLLTNAEQISCSKFAETIIENMA